MASNPSPFRHLPALAFSAALILSLLGCHRTISDPKDPRFIVAEGKGWTITRAQLNTQVETLLHSHQKSRADVPPEQLPKLETDVLKGMVVKRLVLEHAAALKLPDLDKADAASLERLKERFPSDAEFQATLRGAGLTMEQVKQQIHEDTLVRKTLGVEVLQKVPSPSDAEINDFYLHHKDQMTVPDKIRASRVLVAVDEKATPADRAARKKKIDEARARVAKGEDFGKIAAEVSDDHYSAPKGGDIGYFQKGENEAGFDQVAFSSKPGVLSPVFQTPMGYQFIKVTDVHPGGLISVAQARDSISQAMMHEKENDALEAYTKDLITKNNVTFHLVNVNADQLPRAPGSTTATNAAPQ